MKIIIAEKGVCKILCANGKKLNHKNGSTCLAKKSHSAPLERNEMAKEIL
ncbi:MAG: hypothetical protein GW789_09415 [Ignavibacteria bacterium]|nr:hypothetical protein [Ignavibacteria bacterium]